LGGNHCVYTQTVLGVQIFAEKTILGPQFIPFLPVKSIEPLKKGKKNTVPFHFTSWLIGFCIMDYQNPQ